MSDNPTRSDAQSEALKQEALKQEALKQEAREALKQEALKERRRRDAKNVKAQEPVLKPKQPAVTTGPGAQNDATVRKGTSYKEVVKPRLPAEPGPQQDNAPQATKEQSSWKDTVAKSSQPLNNDHVKGNSQPVAAAQVQTQTPKKKFFTNWYEQCIRLLDTDHGEDNFTPVTKETKNIQYFLTELLSMIDLEDEDDDRREIYNNVVRNCVNNLLAKNTSFEAPVLPTEEINFFVADLKYLNGDTDADCELQIRKLWNVLNDSSQQFDVNEDSSILMAMCVVFWATIVFIEEEGRRKQWSPKDVFRDETDLKTRVTIFMFYQNGTLKVDIREPRSFHSVITAPTGLWRPPTMQSRASKGAPSANSEAFLATKSDRYAKELIKALEAAYKQVGTDLKRASEAVYEAFKTAFGWMLAETQKHCFTGWMQQQADKEITKAQWLAVLKESTALWHAVVVQFRILYTALMYTSEDSRRFTGIEVSELAQYADGSLIPSHHISDLRIWCNWAQRDVARGRWGTYVRKEFADNTVHFVRQYQTLLMKRFEATQQQLFGFWFYPSDLCDWVRDLQAKARLKNTPAEAAVDKNARKPFRWPAACKKGDSLADSDSITSVAYKSFCRQNGLWYDNRNSRLQFCQRMRAAWLRVVGAYDLKADGSAPSVHDVKAYLEKQKIFEVEVRRDENGRMQTVYTQPNEILSEPEKHTRRELRNSMSHRRILVYGAPLANPYLCFPSLE